MALHPQCKAFLDILASAGGPPLHELPIADARSVPKRMIDFGGPEEPVARVENRTVPGPAQPIPIRVYRPSLDAKLPVLMFFHGGGYVICDLDSHDRQCRKLANASGMRRHCRRLSSGPRAQVPRGDRRWLRGDAICGGARRRVWRRCHTHGRRG
jgi:hypothetical protein